MSAAIPPSTPPSGRPSSDADPGAVARTELRAGMASLDAPKAPTGAPVTSDLSIDETLLLHSIGWVPVDLVNGVSVYAVPAGVWVWSQGEIAWATEAHQRAVAAAVARLRRECEHVGGSGVVGVEVTIEVHPHHVDVEVVGTAVRPAVSTDAGRTKHRGPLPEVFVSDLSARDFVLLHASGWAPLGLAFGTSFVNVPRRSASTALQQRTQNVELANFTNALYSAREAAMARMQETALHVGASGVVAVHVSEGPLDFAHHVVQFSAWGTAVALVADQHQRISPELVLSLDDRVVTFDARSLRRH
ncbi:MAG: heavy metal-binding domain-containing protein [Acidimicrobiales bacterium]